MTTSQPAALVISRRAPTGPGHRVDDVLGAVAQRHLTTLGDA
jgi:hypothetical protein